VRGTLATRIHPSLGDGGPGYFFDLWARAKGLAGGTPSLEVLGTVRTAPNAARSFVRLSGTRDTSVVSLDWVSGFLIDTGPVPERGLELSYYAAHPDTLARLDMWNGRVIRVAKSEARSASRN
jgi:hypothetical protein